MANEIANVGNPCATGGVHQIDVFGAAHTVIGVFVVPITILALIFMSFGARYPRKTTAIVAMLFLWWVVQFLLAFVGFLGVAALAGLHGINARVMVGLGIYLVKSNWAFRRQGPPLLSPRKPQCPQILSRSDRMID